ncbi:hypothetical protein CLIB1423_07S00738 [[Candida] railenensis]|uniref:BZIP domain-containing protein n=1 Tax=[Candida] railenensis TaxID=45579 RepID=A0A9P0VYE8_9ASCO|nr:hypothetical protein CLIB1423_07S00738 [[Candida] railenensis]
MASNYNERDGTSSALLEQLVYIDNFMSNTSEGTPNLDVDGQLSLDLAAFADDSFIFPDADKPKNNKHGDNNDDHFDHFEVDPSNLDNNRSLPNNNNGNRSDKSNLHHDLTNLINKASPVDFADHYAGHNSLDYYPNGSGHNINGNGHRIEGASTSNPSTLNVSELPKVVVPPGAQSSLVAAGLSQNQIDLLAALVAQHQHSDPKSSQASPAASLTPMNGSSSLSNNNDLGSGGVRQHNQLSNFHSTTDFKDLSSSTSPTTSSSSSSRIKIEGSPINNFSSFSSTARDHSRSLSYESGNNNGGEAGSASELDKRRRNTAASARFRIKKKKREKEMESTISSLSDATRNLELKIQQLEMENKLLRNLIVEKGSKRSEDELRELKERVQLQGEDELKYDQFR